MNGVLRWMYEGLVKTWKWMNMFEVWRSSPFILMGKLLCNMFNNSEIMKVMNETSNSAYVLYELNILMFEWSFYVEKCGRRYTVKKVAELKNRRTFSVNAESAFKVYEFIVYELWKLWMRKVIAHMS